MSDPVREFEAAFAEYVGARYCIALCNGTATLHTALVALGVKAGDRVAVPPLTMSATTIAVLHGFPPSDPHDRWYGPAVPVFCDVFADTWLACGDEWHGLQPGGVAVPVSLYGLHYPTCGASTVIDDAAQTLRPHSGCAFTSYSFQASKILALGEGGMLATNDEALATRAREFSSLGYRMRADQPRIDKRVLKSPAYERHHSLGWNYRMSPLVAAEAMIIDGFWGGPDTHNRLCFGDRHSNGCPASAGGKCDDGDAYTPAEKWDELVRERRVSADLYREAVAGCSWITPQHVPDGWTHDYWAYAVALEHADLWEPFAEAVERHGGTRPFAAWRLTYREPAFRHLAADGCCPVAEDLQPRIVAGQTNDLESAKRNADAWSGAMYELSGGRV